MKTHVETLTTTSKSGRKPATVEDYVRGIESWWKEGKFIKVVCYTDGGDKVTLVRRKISGTAEGLEVGDVFVLDGAKHIRVDTKDVTAKPAELANWGVPALVIEGGEAGSLRWYSKMAHVTLA